ncbi:MAG: hypothetical protein JJU13_18485 [Balneolaceae bacterium]|nr:hypothetical protein [Balneolaceae bacterium]
MKKQIYTHIRFSLFFGLVVLSQFIQTSFVFGQSIILEESDYYQITNVHIPDSIVLEVGGMAFNDDGELAISTRRGELWILSDPESDHPSFQRFGRGLHEPIGLAFRDGAYYIAQRGELTKLEDQIGDGQADVYTTIYRWPLSGNYHEYSYGPKFLPNGEMIVTLNVSWIGHGASLAKWRGWMLKITTDGKITPYATGMRSPLGFGFNSDGDIFYTENEGDWIGSGWLTHVEKGDFTGHPAGLEWSHRSESPLNLRFEDIDDSQGLTLYEQSKNISELKNPSVWFPHAIMGISTSDVLLIDDQNKVGPFAGQFLVGDHGHSKIMRVAMEKINGKYQGAVFNFREGFASGITRLKWGPDNQLYVGMTSRGWSSIGEESFGIERMKWNGKIPFVMHSIRAESNGFTIKFTKPVEELSAIAPDNYQITDFTYNYDRRYGSPVVDREQKQIRNIDLSEDKKSVRLYVDGLREGFINEIQLNGIESLHEERLLHPKAYYTLNQLPSGDRSSLRAIDSTPTGTTNELFGADSKRIISMPPDWEADSVKNFQLGTRPGNIFDLDIFRVRTGEKVALTFTNDDDMPHNVVFTEPGMADAVGESAMNLGLNGAALNYIPNMDEVLFHSSLLGPGESETIYFIAPDQPGDYDYVCTFPGHHFTMRGILQVVNS